MLEQKEAIVRLLRDDDPKTVRLVKQQLAQHGSGGIGDLRDLLLVDDETVTRHVREVIAEIDSRAASDEMSRLCSHFTDDGDLEAANWLLARAFLPGVDVPAAVSELDQWASRLTLIGQPLSAEERVRLLSVFLGERLGFRGNTDDYYNAANSLLPCVLETKLGIPITLVVIYMLVGRRCGVRIEGLNFPGHFLARHGGVLFDPFERGRIIGIPECRQILARQKLELQPDHLAAASSRVMLRRILANLLYAFQNAGEVEKTANVTRWIHALED